MMRTRLAKIGCTILFLVLPGLAQEHRWAGRTLDNVEWQIHQELAALPFHGVFDTLRFEVQDQTIVLSGLVLRETVKENAERAVRRLDGVAIVVNQIEVLPASRADDAIRSKVYRVIYGKQPLEKYGTRAMPSIHIIVKGTYVTLEGVVDSEADRNTAYLRALQAAHHVTNNLRVAPER